MRRLPPRDPSQGPWISSRDIERFLASCNARGLETRMHPDLWRDAHQVRFGGHWMSLIWNKQLRRYTADRRLSLIVQSFASGCNK